VADSRNIKTLQDAVAELLAHLDKSSTTLRAKQTAKSSTRGRTVRAVPKSPGLPKRSKRQR
jgi:hypothetical protein